MRIHADSGGRIPFLTLTGFLGSGKTTVLNRFLREDGKWLVLMNEFGKEPLDQNLMARRDVPLTLLSGGCVCCTVRGALAPMLKNLYMSRSAGTLNFDRVVMETSGVADPGPVLDTLLRDRWLAARFSLLGIVATVDAQQGLERIHNFPEAARQVALADYLLMTKTDLVAPEAVAPLRQKLRQMNPVAEIFAALHGEWKAGGRLASGDFQGGGKKPRLLSAMAEGTAFESASCVFNRPLLGGALDILGRLVSGLGQSLLRIKGILDIEGETNPVAVHAVSGHLYPSTRLAAWPDSERRSRLVAISTASDYARMKRFLSEFEQAVG
jgi:G3E family GTPase